MKKILLFAVAMAVATFTAIYSNAEEPQKEETQKTDDQNDNKLTYGAEMDSTSKYLSRGNIFSKGLALQPSIWGSYYGFTGSVWGNFNTNSKDEVVDALDGDKTKKLMELDYSLTYNLNLFGASIDVGGVYYKYNYQFWEEYLELIAKVSYPIGKFKVFFNNWVSALSEKSNVNGMYYGELGASYEEAIIEKSNLKLSAFTGINSKKQNEYVAPLYDAEEKFINKMSLTHFTLDAQFTYNFTENFYVRPHMTYAMMMGDLKKATEIQIEANSIEHKKSNFVAGLALGCNF